MKADDDDDGVSIYKKQNLAPFPTGLHPLGPGPEIRKEAHELTFFSLRHFDRTISRVPAQKFN